ncbi:MAG: hypothetical protein IT186_09650 [Acidobacteria bacterium]|nr:hypothetical protein [Acidobacteriota bacterium]
MSQRTTPTASLATLAILLLSGCGGTPITVVTVDNFEWRTPKVTIDKAFTTVTNVLVERGFDIKNSTKDAGILTTEYKKFASCCEKQPFDFYLQIKATIRQDPKDTKKVLVRLTPIAKEVNRMNAAAFTENNLYYITVDDSSKNPGDIDWRMRPGSGWLALGQTLFMNVASDISEQLGIPIEEITQNTTKTPGQAGGIRWK